VEGFVVLAIVIAVLVLLDAAAILSGVDSRDLDPREHLAG
jgi:hypothetical protein